MRAGLSGLMGGFGAAGGDGGDGGVLEVVSDLRAVWDDGEFSVLEDDSVNL